MIDFFIHISESFQEKYIIPSKEYFQKLFGDSSIKSTSLPGITVLSVPDINPGGVSSPLYSEKLNAHFFIVGEINFPENQISILPFSSNENIDIRLIHLAETNGFEALQDCSGDFIVAIYFNNEKRFQLINSKLGLFPVYYSGITDGFFVSSRLGVFKKIFDRQKPDLSVIMQYCLYNYPFTSKTFFQGVHQLPSASILEYQADRLKIENYWTIEKELHHDKLNLSDSIDFLDTTFDKLLTRRCKKQERIGISLTGGWDGRLLLAYALEHLTPDKITLYSFGTHQALDVTIPEKISENLGFNYKPVYLDERTYIERQIFWANSTLNYSDGMRSIKRAHYLYSMYLLKHEFGIDNIISGIGGSNLMKSSNYMPCNVFNSFVLELIESENHELTIKKHYHYIINQYPELFTEEDQNSFLSSFDTYSFRNLFKISDKRERFRHYLISEIEKKYFGSELQSYKHLVSNYSPFFDYEFIQAIAKTVFFGTSGIKGLFRSYYNSLLYGRLVSRHNNELAKQITDRNFSLYDVIRPLNYPKMILKYFAARLNKERSSDNFHTEDISSRFLKNAFPEFKVPLNAKVESSFMTNYISAMKFLA